MNLGKTNLPMFAMTMKKIKLVRLLIIFVSPIILLACHDEETIFSEKATVIIQDANLKQCIDNTGLDPLSIKILNCSDANINQLEGIESLQSLTSIDLSNNVLTDISPLVALIQQQKQKNKSRAILLSVNLQNIDLSNNQIVNASKLQLLSDQIDIVLDGNPLQTLPAPSLTRAVRGNNQVTLRWQRVIGANGYLVYMSEDRNTVTKELPLTVSNTRFVVNNLENDTPIYFVIVALFPQGEGLQSEVFSATPSGAVDSPVSPEIVFARTNESDLFIDWQDVNDYLQYRLHYSRNVEFPESETTIIDDVKPPYSLVGLESDTVYHIKIEAGNTVGSQFSLPVTLTTLASSSKGKITPLTAEAGDRLIRLSWTMESDIQTAKIYYALDKIATVEDGIELENPTSPIILTDLDVTKTYHFLLIINDNEGASFSFETQAKPKIAISSLQISDDGLINCLNQNGYTYIADVTMLSCQNLGIRQLSGLGLFTSLTNLNLSHNAIRDVSELQFLTRLISINLSNNLIEDISKLDELTQLQSLQLQNNLIQDLSGINTLTSLTGLGLSENKITDISSIKLLTNLKRLQLSKNQMQDVDALAELQNLTHLNLADNKISSINSLRDLTLLRYIDVSNNQITDFSVLNQLQKLAFRNQQNNVDPAEKAINNKPVANAGEDVSLNELSSVDLDGSGSSDLDGDELTFLWQIVSKPSDSNANITNPNTAIASFTPDVVGEYLISLAVTDGKSSADIDVITIFYENVSLSTIPVAVVGENILTLISQTIPLDGSNSSDESNDALTYRWTIDNAPEGSNASIENPDNSITNLIPDTFGIYQISLIVSDGYSDSEPAIIMINYENRAPEVVFNEDTNGNSGQIIVLDASLSTDVNQQDLSFLWQIDQAPDGSEASIDNATSDIASFKPDISGDYEIRVTVSDGLLESQAVINILHDNKPPTARAQNEIRVKVGQTALLDGSKSTDIDGDGLTYQWTIVNAPNGSTAVLANDKNSQAQLLPDVEGPYEVQLLVSDGQNVSLPHITKIVFGNITPIAKVGPKILTQVGETIWLDGSSSYDEDGNLLKYNWQLKSRAESSQATLTDNQIMRPSMTIDVAGSYEVELTVTDGSRTSEPDSLKIETSNTPPIANPGDNKSVQVGDVITLDGSRSSDINGDRLIYSWSISKKPESSTATLSSTSMIRPVLSIDAKGEYVIQLLVNDGSVDSEPKTIKLFTENLPPIANAGNDISETIGNTVEINGNQSFDPENQPIGFEWALINKPESSSTELTSANDIITGFSVDVSGDYVVQLIVNDGEAFSEPDTVLINSSRTRPVSLLADEISLTQGETITLDGSNSFDVDDDNLRYRWSFLFTPPLNKAELSRTFGRTVSFEPLWEGEYIVQLITTDGDFYSEPATSYIKVDLGQDDDNDGLNNTLEERYGSDPLVADSDGDGLNDGDEVKRHETDPIDADTDDDGLNDGEEINQYKTDPLNEDSDGDGLLDGKEVKETLTNPNDPDSDKDGWNDNLEVEAGTNPNSANSKPLVMSQPNDITVLRTGVSSSVALNSIVGEVKDINVLRVDASQTNDVPLNTLMATPQDIAVLRTAIDINSDVSLNLILGNPSDVSALRIGLDRSNNVPLNTIVADPQDVTVKLQ